MVAFPARVSYVKRTQRKHCEFRLNCQVNLIGIFIGKGERLRPIYFSRHCRVVGNKKKYQNNFHSHTSASSGGSCDSQFFFSSYEDDIFNFFSLSVDVTFFFLLIRGL